MLNDDCMGIMEIIVYSILQEHMATHTGVDLYNCSYCETSFKSKSSRSTHYRRHHPVEYSNNMVIRPRPSAITSYENNESLE